LIRACIAAPLALTLAGCGAPALPGVAGVAAAGKLGARGLSPDAADQVITKATAAALPQVVLGVQAVLKAPSDAWAQRGLGNLYGQAMDRALPAIPAEVDEAKWPKAMAEFQKQYPAITDPEVLAYVQGIADRLAKASNQTTFKVFVSDVPWADAFNAGGHAMMVFSGLIVNLNDEAELASIMGHEMAHGLRRHMVRGNVGGRAQYAATQRSAELNQPSEGDLQLINSFIASLGPAQQADADFVLSHVQDKVGAETLGHLRFHYNSVFAQITSKREMEAESDQIGTRLAAAAGYDPMAGVRSFERFNLRADGDTRYYDHPAHGSRAAAMKETIARLGLKGDDRGAERLAAIKLKLTSAGRVAPADQYVRPAGAAGAGCYHGAPWQPVTLN
jgi:predicted Zn-dependent protease